MNGNMLLSPDALHCLKRKQLTNLCRRFGIKAVGKNADLIRQLQEYAASNIPSNSPTKGNVPILRHVKRPRQSDSSQESGTDDLQTIDEKPESASLPYPPLTPRTRQKRVSDMVKAIEDVKQLDDDMDTDDDDDDNATLSQRNTIVFPASSPAPTRSLSPLAPSIDTEASEITQPLRIIKALPSSNRLASPLSSATILEMNRSTVVAGDGSSNLYPDLSTLPLPEGVSSDCLASSSTLPSITSRQFSAAAASVLAEMNARLTAAGRSATSGSLATASSIGNGTWQNLAASASSQGMSKSRSGRYEIHHERQFKKMDSIVHHYAARRVGAGATSSLTDSSQSAASSSSGSSSSTTAATASSVSAARMTASTSTSRRTRVDASTSTRSLAAMTRSTSARKVPTQRRPLPTPPVSSVRPPPPTTLPHSTTRAQIVQLRHASNNTVATNASSDPPRAKRLRLAVSEDQDALQNTVLEIPPEKKTVVIRVTRPDREGMPYKFSVASSSTADIESAPTRAASSLRKTVIKATKGTFAGSGGSAKKATTSAQSQKREAAFVKQQQQQAAMSRSMSSRANLASTGGGGVTGTRNKFTGVTTMASGTGKPTEESQSSARKPSAAVSTMSGATEASKHGSISSRFGGSIRSSVSQGLGRAEMARQARLKEIKARTKAALAGFGSQRNVSATATVDETASASPDKQSVASTFSPSVMRPTIASLNRSSGSNASASLPMLSAITRSAAVPTLVTETLQRAATIHAGVGKVLTPCLTPRSSSLRHLRRVMRKQQKEADLEQVRVAAAENIAPGDVVPSVLLGTAGVKSAQSTISKHSVLGKQEQEDANPSIRTVAARGASPNKMHPTTPRGMAARPAGPRTALVASRATTSALNRV